MALMRIAFAAAALVYIAPHLGIDLGRSARSLMTGVTSEAGTAEAIAGTALVYCQKNPEICLKVARAALAAEPSGETMLAHAGLRPSLQDHAQAPDAVPLPPARPLDLRPAMK